VARRPPTDPPSDPGELPPELGDRAGAGAGPLRHAGRLPWLARWLWSAPARWLGEGSSVAQDLTGAPHGLSYLRHLARGNRIRRRTTFERLDNDSPPVLLLHGFLGTRGSMFPLERRLAAEGFTVISFNLGALNSRDIRASAFLIHRKIESILQQTSLDRIDIVGHSMGGLIGLYYIKKLGGHARVRRLIMMGTPVTGTWAALAGVATLGLWSKSSWQLLPRSRFLDELSQGPIPPGVEVYTLAAARDWVCPLKTTRVRGATAVTVPLGHSSLVISEVVFARIVAILRGQVRRAREDADHLWSGLRVVEPPAEQEPAAEGEAAAHRARRPARGGRR
jgi:pimeloyl-ACP methyl ester carboxylesterase